MTEITNIDNNTAPCHTRKIPLWLVLLDNIPTLLMLVLGFLIIKQLTLTGAIFYGVYAAISIIWFWVFICPYCHHYDTYACPCGYGMISSRLFKRKEDKSFSKVFRHNIAIQYPNWFIPVGFAVYLMITSYSVVILVLTVSFVITGFIIIPTISKLVGCKNCEIKADCPWMANRRKAA